MLFSHPIRSKQKPITNWLRAIFPALGNGVTFSSAWALRVPIGALEYFNEFLITEYFNFGCTSAITKATLYQVTVT